MLVVLGVATYYVAPAAFLFGHLDIFFFIMNGLLLIMILGLTFISILLLPGLQRIIVAIFTTIYWKDRKIKVLVLKSIKSHQRRNTKTAIMFSICLSFLIFSGSGFQLIGDLTTATIETTVGADLYAVLLSRTNPSNFLDEEGISKFLLEQRDLDGSIESFSFASLSLGNYLKTLHGPRGSVDGTFFSDISGYT